MGLINRTGHSITMFLHDGKGTGKELSGSEYSFLFVHNARSMVEMLKTSLSRKDPRAAYLLAMAFAKRFILHRDIEKERLLLFERLLGFKGTSVRLAMNGRTVEIGDFENIRPFIKCIFVHNQYDANEENIKGKVVVDGGAHVGVFSIMAALLGAKKVYAFEPIKETFEMLKHNVETNGLGKTIIPVNLALGEKKDSRTMYWSKP